MRKLWNRSKNSSGTAVTFVHGPNDSRLVVIDAPTPSSISTLLATITELQIVDEAALAEALKRWRNRNERSSHNLKDAAKFSRDELVKRIPAWVNEYFIVNSAEFKNEPIRFEMVYQLSPAGDELEICHRLSSMERPDHGKIYAAIAQIRRLSPEVYFSWSTKFEVEPQHYI